MAKLLPKSRPLITPQPSVAQAKNQLRQNAADIDYLAPIKENPLQSVGIAFVTGLIVAAEKSSSLTSNITTLAAKTLIKV